MSFVFSHAGGHSRQAAGTLRHYAEADDRNRVICHNYSAETSDKIAVVLKDASALKDLCSSDYERYPSPKGAVWVVHIGSSAIPKHSL